MSTSSHSTALSAHAPAQASPGQNLLARLHDFVARIRAAAAERRLRYKLADLSDSILRDIGIADDEIPRVRALEQFTPRAWADRMGSRPRSKF